ncbi:MAG: glucosidase [Ferruginibacter sp.]
MKQISGAERRRLIENRTHDNPLEKWGCYLSERQWGTVREDYSEDGNAWQYFPFEHAKSRTYIWGEDGIAGYCDYFQNICFAPAMWNGKDPIIKERLFGLANGQGNHGEDVKELYYYLDNTPTHYYMKYLYKYPQQEFPYKDLLAKNKARTLLEPEYELLDTGVFDNNEYFDVYIEYAKLNSEDVYICIEVVNRAASEAPFVLLPTIWIYNRWQNGTLKERPLLQQVRDGMLNIAHERMGNYFFYFTPTGEQYFAENETNTELLLNIPNKYAFPKDAINDVIVTGKNKAKMKANKSGTKFSPVYRVSIKGGESQKFYFRLSSTQVDEAFAPGFEEIFSIRKKEADEFYSSLIHAPEPDIANIERQAYAGLMWTKQYYHYDVEWWLQSSDGITPPSKARETGRNSTWQYLKNQDIISMPDKWEYPWYAAWDLAFHTISLALVDATYAKHQLILLMREWFMNQDGQLPAYEWDFSSVNPPVHAFAAMEVYRIDKRINGKADISFLKRIFQKLIINFTWWVNRKDANGNSIFEGGFLGMDNIGIFNRNETLAEGLRLEQTDGTSWMGIYALNMMEIAFEIAMNDASFEDSVTKFYEHFVIIAEALNQLDLWDNEDGFFYDVLSVNQKEKIPMRVRSIVGLIPLCAVSLFENNAIDNMHDFSKRMSWFENYRISNDKYLPNEEGNNNKTLLLSLVNKERLQIIIQRFLDSDEFLSDYGIRSVSRYYKENPYSVTIHGEEYAIEYDPADSTSTMFGGNSNWRGPIWMPINYIFIKSLHRYGEFYGDSLTVEFPSRSGNMISLRQLARELTIRLLKIFMRNESGDRPVYATYNEFYKREENKYLMQFFEYFDGDTGRGLGASHQTGWTALILNLIADFKDTMEQ